MSSLHQTEIAECSSIDGSSGDCLVLVTSCLELAAKTAALKGVADGIKAQIAIEPNAAQGGCVVAVAGVAGGRVVFSPTGPLDRDFDDSRRWSEAAASGIKRAIECGSQRPVLAVVGGPAWPRAKLLALLGALDAVYVPIEIREDVPDKKSKLKKLAVFDFPSSVIAVANQLDQGKVAAKDIGGSDPERMAPPRVLQYAKELFGGSNSCIKMTVVSDDQLLEKEYPLFAAVNRGAKGIDRHKGCIIFLQYTPPKGPVKKSVYLVGKGVTYDTGGADIKAGGVMAGMHRDKCGAAAVAGYFRFLDLARPANIAVQGALCMVRNSVGSNCYVADELITSRAGVRIRVGNTDAEGRMAMADSLSRMKDLAQGQPDPHLFTVATLTGHCVLAHGEGYTSIMENGPAKQAKIGYNFQDAGEELAEPVEISSIRREDYAFHKGKSEYEDVLQCNNQPSSRTARGHQTPAAFLIMASGLDKHGKDSKAPLKYCHVDMAASAGPFPGLPTGAPILALAKTFSPEIF